MKNSISVLVLCALLSAAFFSCKKEDADGTESDHLTATFLLDKCGTNDSIVAKLHQLASGSSVILTVSGRNYQKIDFGVVEPGSYYISGDVATKSSPCLYKGYISEGFWVESGKGKHVNITN